MHVQRRLRVRCTPEGEMTHGPCWIEKCRVAPVVNAIQPPLTKPGSLRRLFRLITGLERKQVVGVLAETINQWDRDRVPRLSASLTFYMLLSAAPLIVVVVAVAAIAYGQEAARGQLAWQIQGLVGYEIAKGIQQLILSAYKPGSGLIASVLSLLALAIGASSVVVELRDALNTIWHVPAPEGKHGLSSFFYILKQRAYSFALVLGGGFLLLLSVALSTVIAGMGKLFGPYLPASEFLLHVGAFALSLLGIAFFFGAIYKMLPEVALDWSDVIVGAFVTAFLFTIGKQLIAMYLGHATIGSPYGTAGSLVLFLAWIYYSAQLFFLGAEFTKVYTKTRIAAGTRESGKLVVKTD